MREILFRGKRLDNGVWITGAYHPGGGRHFIFPLALTTDTSRIKVVPETVGQFTGLLDKNGNRIFEGDRVVYPDSTSYGGYDDYNEGVVDYDVEAMRFYFTGRWSVEMEDFDVVDGMMVDVEIIGNIHDRRDSCEEIVLGSYDSEGNLEQSLRISAYRLTLENVSGEKLSIYQGDALEDLADMLGRR